MTINRDAGEDLLHILDEPNEPISNIRSMPMNVSTIVNRENALHLIDRARDAVPSTVRRAEKIVADADAVLAKGRTEFEWLTQYAQEESKRLVAGENIVRMTDDRTDNIVATVEDEAASLRHGVDEYSDRTLASLETEVARIAEQICTDHEVLAGHLSDDAGQPVEIQESAHRRSGWSVDPPAH